MGYLEVNYGIPTLAAICAAMVDGIPQQEETMGDRIRNLREARNLTQPALTRLLVSMGAPSTLTKAAVHKWETGDSKNIQNATFILLCKALGTDPEFLLWGNARVPQERPTRLTAAKRKT